MKTTFALTPLAVLIPLLAASAAAAQEVQPMPSTPEACMAVESNAARLACYDAAVGRQAHNTELADAQAAAAKQALDESRVADSTAKESALQKGRRKLGAVYGVDDPMLEEAVANAGKGSLLDSRWELARDSKLGVFQMRGYKPVYLLPAFWTSDKNEMPQSPNPNNTVTEAQPLTSVEAKFQLSFKTKFVENIFGDNGDLWGAYTQSSRWQVYNGDISRPFRETNYEPEVMLVFRNSYHIGGWNGRMTGISLVHQSNGRSDPLSRSWNRAILSFGLDRDNWAFVARPWYRFDEDSSDDNNPDIEDYVGRGDAMLTYSKDGHEFTVLGRHSLRGGDRSHGALQFDYGFPISRQLRGHLQLFHGYGESLIDYNHKATYLGLGVSLLEWY
ncbi:phospholipase A [Pseudoxanthomonas dokdonensis]|uniref:Phospholipase A1 n=1 Tax=Pseudoxanthomonas dokdonensis TaxID=344882 RepID=A0A0R0CHI5_9GAMM|nr:phospholipase A [Pseudoxanthomonas dokdonensis]KRG68843.1 phospholipase [Pseudoxanthomonas dokdonensis]